MTSDGARAAQFRKEDMSSKFRGLTDISRKIIITAGRARSHGAAAGAVPAAESNTVESDAMLRETIYGAQFARVLEAERSEVELMRASMQHVGAIARLTTKRIRWSTLFLR
jgi:hypothetical protein